MKQAAVVLGTSEGAYRVDHGGVTPLGAGHESVTCLARLQDQELLAGTRAGALWISSEQGSEWQQLPGPRGPAPILSLQNMEGEADETLAYQGDGRLWRYTRARGLQPAAGQTPFEPWPGQAELTEVPGPDAGCLLCREGDGLYRSRRPFESFELVRPLPSRAIRSVAIHPTDADLWLLATSAGLMRSRDRGRTYQPVALPGGSALRTIAFEHSTPHRLFCLAEPAGSTAARSDPASLLVSKDGGLSVQSWPAGLIDTARDPSGEITAFRIDSKRQRLYYGTNRGELFYLALRDDRVEAVTRDLPPIQSMILGASSSAIDPSTSGIFMLP